MRTAMRGIILALALVSIAMSAVAQVLFKAGMSAAPVRAALAAGGAPRVIRAVALNPGVLGGLALYGLGTVLWLAVLSRAELSQAYPFVGLSFVLTAVFGVVLFHDALSVSRIAGIAAIVVGVYLVGQS
jgi:drug/metabolite transporter (DMT)-like permease